MGQEGEGLVQCSAVKGTWDGAGRGRTAAVQCSERNMGWGRKGEDWCSAVHEQSFLLRWSVSETDLQTDRDRKIKRDSDRHRDIQGKLGRQSRDIQTYRES